MNELTRKSCEACRIGAPLASQEETNQYMQMLPDWSVVQVDEIKQLKRTFPFDTFADALAFSQKVGALAEKEGHHPAILTEWGKVTIFWWSHKIQGLHVNDFVMAAKTDLL